MKIPPDETIEDYKKAIASKHPLLRDVWMTMDGLKLHLEASPSCAIQNCFYNGWTHDHYMSNILIFSPAGTIVVACLNIPGSIHDLKITNWGNIYSKLEKVFKKMVEDALLIVHFPEVATIFC